MQPETFSSENGADAQAKFQQWQADNPSGFYLNLKARKRAMLHRVGCGHVGGAGEWNPESGDVARKAKVCHTDRKTLTDWAAENGYDVDLCADCRL